MPIFLLKMVSFQFVLAILRLFSFDRLMMVWHYLNYHIRFSCLNCRAAFILRFVKSFVAKLSLWILALHKNMKLRLEFSIWLAKQVHCVLVVRVLFIICLVVKILGMEYSCYNWLNHQGCIYLHLYLLLGCWDSSRNLKVVQTPFQGVICFFHSVKLDKWRVGMPLLSWL